MPEQEVLAAEKAANELLDQWWWSSGRGVPVDPFVLARQLGIRVRTARLPDDQSGNIVMRHNATPVITLNERDTLNRRRFTCAHEIGHYERRTRGNDQSFTDYRDTLAGLGVNPGEVYANQFAAALLMPAKEVRRLYAAGQSVEQLARTFVTSPQAMGIRLRNLRLP